MSFLDELFGDKKEEKLTSPKKASHKLFNNEAIEQIIQQSSLRVIKSKIDKTNSREQDNMGRRPLYYATLYGKIDVIEYLFELGSDFEDARVNALSTAMETIIQSANAAVLSTYLKHGFIFIDSKRDTKAMCLAMIGCPLEFIELLIEMEVPMSIYTDKDNVSFTPVEYAMLHNRDVEIIELLIKSGSPLKEDKPDSHLVFTIIDRVSEPIAKKKLFALLKKLDKLDVNIQDELGNTPIDLAVKNSDMVAIKELILLGANFNKHHHKMKRLFNSEDLQQLVDSIEENGGEIRKFLSLLSFESIENYLLNNDDIKSENIIYQIATNTRIEEEQKVKLLNVALKFESNMDSVTPDGGNPLFAVCKNLKSNMPITVVKFLLEQGSSIEFKGKSAFLEAIYNDNMPLVKLFLEYNADVNFIDEDNQGVVSQFYKEHTTINTIVKKRELLTLLFSYGFDINNKIAYKDHKELFSSFAVIIFEKEFKLIENLLEEGINLTDDDIVYHGLKNIKKDALLKRIIEINPYYVKENYFKRAGETADGNILHIAINYQHTNIVEYILDTYPDVVAYSELEPIAITLFESVNYPLALVEKLIKRDSDINRHYIFKSLNKIKDEAPLLIQAVKRASKFNSKHRYFFIVKLLLENGADINSTFKLRHRKQEFIDENSIFVEAMDQRKLNKELFDLLYEFGGSLIKPIANFKEMPIHTIVQRHLVNDDLAIEYLEYCWDKEPFDLEYKNSFDTNLFLGAAMNCLPKTLQWLANKGANIHIVGGHDNSPALHKAIVSYEYIETMQRLKTVQILIELGCDIEQYDNEQMTPLMCAASVGVGQVVKELIKSGADVNAQNESGESAIHYTILGRNSFDFPRQFQSVKSKIIKELVENGADINQVVKAGETPLIYAINSGFREIFSTLLQLQADINTPCDDGYLPLYYALCLKDQYFTNVLRTREDLEVNKTNKFDYSTVHYLLFVNFHPSTLKEILEILQELKADMNIHKEIDPPLLMYIKTMEFIGERQVGFVSSKKQPKESEDKKAKLFIEYGAHVDLALEVAKSQKESKDIIEYLESLQDEILK